MLVRTSVQHTNSIHKKIESKISLFPNPVNQSFKLSGFIPSKNVQIQLLSYNGQIIENFGGQLTDNQGELIVNLTCNYNGAAFVIVEYLNEKISIPVVVNNKN
jgi:hypothetical protein